MRRALILVAAGLLLSGPVWAEGEYTPDEGEAAASPPKPKAAPRKRAVRKPAATRALPPEVTKALTPSEPIPYLTIKGATPAATTEAPPHQPPTSQPLPPLEAQVVIAPAQITPQSAPQITLPPPPPPRPPAPDEIALSCETLVSRDGKGQTRGKFTLILTPSPVFDDQAHFRVSQIEPGHDSLIRHSLCLDMPCRAEVSPGMYYLVHQPDRKKDSLRITLDRTKGAYAAEYGRDGKYVTEQGWCKPVTDRQPLF